MLASSAIPDARALLRGSGRLLADHGFACLGEFRLGNGRRADLAGIDAKGRVVIVEIKCSLADYRADRKWPDYLGYCDLFYFAVGAGFPRRELEAATARPELWGLIVADGFGGAILREAAERPLAPARRRALLVRFARTAALRLDLRADPRL
ncbi:MAG: MmcB family DNA repair protein [Rhodothalassiaceae bacterium]